MSDIKICDTCERQIRADLFQFMLVAEYPKNGVRGIRNRSEQDMCADCATAVNLFVNSLPTIEAA